MEIREIADKIMKSLNEQKSIAYSELYKKISEEKGVEKSIFYAIVKDLVKEEFIDYEGNYDDDKYAVITGPGEEMLNDYGSYKQYLESKRLTKYEKTIRWGKNNIVIVAIVLIISGFGFVFVFVTQIKALNKIENTLENTPKNTRSQIRKINKSTGYYNYLGSIYRHRTDSIKNYSDSVSNYNDNIMPPPAKEHFCDNINTILKGLSSGFKNIGEELPDGTWRSKIALDGSHKTEIIKLDYGFVFKAFYYYDKNENTATAIFEKLKDNLKCISGNRSQPVNKKTKQMEYIIHNEDKCVVVYYTISQEAPVYYTVYIAIRNYANGTGL